MSSGVLACGLCGSDVEKIGSAPEGTVLGHEVVAEADGKRVALVHHQPCGACERCRAGHESTCAEFGAATIQPGGFAERVAALGGWVELPDDVDDVLGSYAEPLACVLRGAERVPPGEVLVLGGGFVGATLRGGPAPARRHRLRARPGAGAKRPRTAGAGGLSRRLRLGRGRRCGLGGRAGRLRSLLRRCRRARLRRNSTGARSP